MMDDERFQHFCNLAAIQIGLMRNMTREEYIEWGVEASEDDFWNEYNMKSIMAETCEELMRRLGVKARYKVKAESRPVDLVDMAERA
jgi:hypothetical protein